MSEGRRHTVRVFRGGEDPGAHADPSCKEGKSVRLVNQGKGGAVFDEETG